MRSSELGSGASPSQTTFLLPFLVETLPGGRSNEVVNIDLVVTLSDSHREFSDSMYVVDDGCT